MFTNKISHANTKLNSYSVILSGLAIACSPWTQSYPVLLIIGAAFGLSSGMVKHWSFSILWSICFFKSSDNINKKDSRLYRGLCLHWHDIIITQNNTRDDKITWTFLITLKQIRRTYPNFF